MLTWVHFWLCDLKQCHCLYWLQVHTNIDTHTHTHTSLAVLRDWPCNQCAWWEGTWRQCHRQQTQAELWSHTPSTPAGYLTKKQSLSTFKHSKSNQKHSIFLKPGSQYNAGAYVVSVPSVKPTSQYDAGAYVVSVLSVSSIKKRTKKKFRQRKLPVLRHSSLMRDIFCRPVWAQVSVRLELCMTS